MVTVNDEEGKKLSGLFEVIIVFNYDYDYEYYIMCIVGDFISLM